MSNRIVNEIRRVAYCLLIAVLFTLAAPWIGSKNVFSDSGGLIDLCINFVFAMAGSFVGSELAKIDFFRF
jgi:hypothetical protein